MDNQLKPDGRQVTRLPADKLAGTLAGAHARVMGRDGVAFLEVLRSNRSLIAAHFTTSTELMEAFAVLAEWDGTAGIAVKQIDEVMPTLSREVANAGHAMLGRLLVLSGSRERASTELAEAESLSTDPSGHARIARDRALLAMTERQWSKAEAELSRVEKTCATVGDSLAASEAAMYRAIACVGSGATAEALDILTREFERMPVGGMLELRSLLVLARAHVDFIELERASEYIDRARALCTPELFESYARMLHLDAEIASWRCDWDAARRHLDLLLRLSDEKQLPIYEAHSAYTFALLEFDAEDFSSAISYATRAAEIGGRIEHISLVNAARLVQAASLAKLGQRGNALKAYRSVRKTNIEGIDAVYFDGLMALAEVLLAQTSTLLDEAQALEKLAHDRLTALATRNAQGVRHLESNFHFHILARRLRRHTDAHGLIARLITKVRPTLIDEDGQFIELSNGERVSLQQRPTLQRVLMCLRRNAVARPNHPVPPDELIDASWPSDRASEASLRVRLRVAIATLRQLGLDDAIRTQQGGYFLSLAPPHPDA